MAIRPSLEAPGGAIRRPSVAGSFYPATPASLAALVHELLAEAERLAAGTEPAGQAVLGLLVPHAGLEYSGVVAAAGWRLLGRDQGDVPSTVVILGTNHVAAWLAGVAVWEAGAWRTPLGDLAVDAELARAIVELGPPFTVDQRAHNGEHSIEVQLPFVQIVEPEARIVPLSVAANDLTRAIAAGTRLGDLLARHRAAGERIVLAVSSDMAHYPSSTESERVTVALLPSIERLDAAGLARAERHIVDAGAPGLLCGMCGIAPAVLGLAAMRALGASKASPMAAATSADAGGPDERTVGYLAVAFIA